MYALTGTTMVIKTPNAPEKRTELHRDALVHGDATTAFNTVPSALRNDINVPTFHGFVGPNPSLSGTTTLHLSRKG